jgi:hypothetical protein
LVGLWLEASPEKSNTLSPKLPEQKAGWRYDLNGTVIV